MQAPLSFPATAANSLIQGYCTDFIALAASMAQTLEQATMRELAIDESREMLARVERGMRDLADAIGGVIGSAAPAAAAPTARPAAQALAQARPAAATQPQKRPAKPGKMKGPQDLVGSSERPGPRAMPVAPAAAVPPADAAVRRPAAAAKPAPSLDPTRMPVSPKANSMLAGSNDTMPLRSVFQFLARMRKSGTLRVAIDGEEMAFEIGDGCLIATTSNQTVQNERLGDLLIELGFLTPMDVELFARHHGHSLRQLGGALVQEGRLTEGQLAEALELQVSRRFKRAVAAQKANYDFRECPRPRGDGRIRIRPFEVLANDLGQQPQ